MFLGELVEIPVGERDDDGIGQADYRSRAGLDIDQLHLTKGISRMEHRDLTHGSCCFVWMLLNGYLTFENEIHRIVWFALGEDTGAFGVMTLVQARAYDLELCGRQSPEHAVLDEKIISKGA